MKIFTFLLFAIILLLSCINQNGSNNSEGKGIISENGQLKIESTIFDEMVGVVVGGGDFCTGFASGPNEISTAAHCVKNSDCIFQQCDFYFKPFKGTSQKILSAKIYDERKDYAVFTLDRTFSKYFESAQISFEKKASILSYGIRQGTIDTKDKCSIHQYDGIKGTFSHSCELAEGTSGSPIIQENKVVGIHIDNIPSQNTNLAISMISLTDQNFRDINLDKIPFQFMLGAHCDTDCDERSKFRYPCGIGKTCTGKNPALFATCSLQKSQDCNRVAWCVVNSLSSVIDGYACYACIAALIGTNGVAAAAIGMACTATCGKTAYDIASAVDQCRK